MSRIKPAHVVIALALALAALWVVRNTEWGEVTLPAPLRGEAARNPFYAAERLVTALGATTERRQTLGSTSTSAALVLSHWGWDINSARRRELERWVEEGGRLVVDSTLISGSDAFERWTGIERVRFSPDELDAEEGEASAAADPEGCERLLELRYEADGRATEVDDYEGCAFDGAEWLVTTRRLAWAMSGSSGLEAARVPIGAGSVTVVDAAPFHYREIFDGDHAALLVAATALNVGDHVVFLSEEDYKALPALVWEHGAPVVGAALLALALALWRGAARFGPLVPPAERARRSLGEQVLGTGRFVLRVSGGAALHVAAVRALDEAARRRIVAYETLGPDERVAAIGRLAAVDAAALRAAVDPHATRGAHELRGRLALLETARRQLISRRQWSKHGNPI